MTLAGLRATDRTPLPFPWVLGSKARFNDQELALRRAGALGHRQWG